MKNPENLKRYQKEPQETFKSLRNTNKPENFLSDVKNETEKIRNIFEKSWKARNFESPKKDGKIAENLEECRNM